MKIWRLWSGGLVLTLVVFISCAIGLAQVDIFLPGTQLGTYTGNAIDFGAVPVGTTKTATYTFKILETSATAGTVTQIAFPGGYLSAPPFGLTNLPAIPITIPPGGSITFQVTFTPTAIQLYTGQFTITVQGGKPLQVKKQTVTLTGQGVAHTGEGPEPIPTEMVDLSLTGKEPITVTLPTTTEDTAKLETKLDTVGSVLAELRKKLDNLGWWLGKLTVGYPIGIEPYSTNPMPETDLWRLLASLEAKLDRLAQQPSEVTAPDINITIIEIYNIIVEINQFIINLGGNVAGLEAKLDQLSSDLFDLWLDLMDILDDLNGMWDDLNGMWGDMLDRFDDVEDAIAANTNAIKALQASNARIEDKLNQLLGLPAAPTTAKVTLTVTPELVSASDHSATLEGVAGAVEGDVLVNIYWLGRDNWRPGVTDPFWFDSVTANPNGSFSFTKDGWGSSWPVWCEITQTNASGESAPVRVYLSTLMIGM
ncbi:TPA: hypothetical protein DIT45_01420 [Candidatus Acetothermia bacterium]|nr:hypothetical protein [Candidatus Acetothermia bacterium]